MKSLLKITPCITIAGVIAYRVFRKKRQIDKRAEHAEGLNVSFYQDNIIADHKTGRKKYHQI